MIRKGAGLAAQRAVGGSGIKRARPWMVRANARELATQRGYRVAQSQVDPNTKEKNKTTFIYLASIAMFGVGMSYAAVPLYKIFCQVTGFGGTTQAVTAEDARRVVPVPGATPVRVQFVANTSSTLPWKFKPQQREVRIVPGEVSLAFYQATNTSDKPVVGISTYNITPNKAGVYFHKIQCFCFDQQRLRPNESVDMPILFYIDPTFADDPRMNGVKDIVLSYTFYPAKN